MSFLKAQVTEVTGWRFLGGMKATRLVTVGVGQRKLMQLVLNVGHNVTCTQLIARRVVSNTWRHQLTAATTGHAAKFIHLQNKTQMIHSNSKLQLASSSSSSSRASPGWSVAVSTSCLHRSLSWASRHAELSSWLSGWRSAFRFRSQV